MSIEQVAKLDEADHLSVGGIYQDTCMLVAADSFTPRDASPELYQ